MAFTQKQLRFTFELPAEGSPSSETPTPAANTFVLSGLRATVAITLAGSIDQGQCDIAIYGMSLSHTNHLSTLGQLIDMQRRNTVTVEAGDETNGMSVAYRGVIINGWADFGAMPNNAFRIMAQAAGYIRLQPIPPTSVNSAQADAATILAGLAKQSGYHFVNYGVTSKIAYPYYPGAVLEQIERCAKAARADHVIDHITNTLVIWPLGGSRGGQVPVISQKTGMIGYPAFTSQGVEITMHYTPAISYGNTVSVEGSALTAANKQWKINSLMHELDTRVPGGQWLTRFQGGKPELTLVQGGH